MKTENDVAIYTCVTGNYDRVSEPPKQNGVDYFCFTDVPFVSAVWNVLPIPEELCFLDDVKKQRVVKICPHRYLPKKYTASLWLDGNITFRGNVFELIETYDLKKNPLYVRIHPSRRCAYEEARAVLEFGKEDPRIVRAVVEKYKREGFPEKIGLAETGIVLRDHENQKCRDFDDAWVVEVMNNSKRDQLSFNYVAWKKKFRIGYMTKNFKLKNDDWFEIRKHG